MNGLLSILHPDRPVCIVVHNNPDPDSLASAMALQYFLKKKGFPRVRAIYNGFIGRAENKAMIKILKIPIHHLKNARIPSRRQFVLLDSQPGAGNVTLPENAEPLAAIDHHPLRQRTKRLSFYDVRPNYGACSTIIYEYLVSEDIVIPAPVATALFHAIFSETQGLGREGSPEDKKAYLDLLPRVNFKRLSRIQYPPLSRDFISNLQRVLTRGFYYRQLAGAILEELPYPDFAAEIADFLLRIKNIRWSICLGNYADLIYVSIRSNTTHANAARLLKKAIPKSGTAGGHELIAGAQVRIGRDEIEKVGALKREIVRKVLRELYHTNIDSVIHLVSDEPILFPTD